MQFNYCESLVSYKRRKSIEVNIGGVPLGDNYPIRIQSMTTVDTMDTEASIEECIRMIEAGCEYIRITAPSIKEANNLENIKQGLRSKGYAIPLVADIHFTPNAAEVAAKYVEKVRINPGNYADKKKFDIIEYTDEAYQVELDRIKEKFIPLIRLCKKHNTSMRIGTNHGSLSDRIMSKYGDTPIGMVESALEFLRICEDEAFYDVVISMKSSNTRVMVQAYRLLSYKLNEEGLKAYPLHLGVTEAGEAEDGRIKSAIGIGTLLEDGLGDTIRVSLTEAPEYEPPVAKKIIERYKNRINHAKINEVVIPINPFEYKKRESFELGLIGGQNVPRVIATFTDEKINKSILEFAGYFYNPVLDKWSMTDQGADFIYTGSFELPFELPNGAKHIIDFQYWNENSNSFPMFNLKEFKNANKVHQKLNFINILDSEANENNLLKIKNYENIVLVLESQNIHAMPALRSVFFNFIKFGIKHPIIIKREYKFDHEEQFLIDSSIDIGGLLIDGLGDGVMLLNNNIKLANETAFGILQAARTRMTKTEYISCPSCGRTLFDLQETTAKIRKHTDHLKGVKIGVMGCIVNGPGEMADADYGYVGSGKDKITLYKGQEIMKKGVPSHMALDELINIIKEDGNWIEPIKLN